jgi:uncharacterized protein (UPF0332 family)
MASVVKRKPLHEQLLKQAEHLATKDKRGNPPQASLRRAVSAAYYAVFHLLIHAASCSLAHGPARKNLRNLLSRAFDHGEMNSACKSFGSGGKLPDAIGDIYGSTVVVPADLKGVAEVFCSLQMQRHKADYAVHQRFTRTQAIDAVNRAKGAFDAWERVCKDPTARLFLTCLLIQRKLQGR